MTNTQRMRLLETRLRNDRMVRQWDETITKCRMVRRMDPQSYGTGSARSIAAQVRDQIEYHRFGGSDRNRGAIY